MNSTATFAILVGTGLGLAGVLTSTKRVNEAWKDFHKKEADWQSQRRALELRLEEFTLNGAPGGEQGSPPAGDALFNQLDIISALSHGLYLAGPYAAIQANGDRRF